MLVSTLGKSTSLLGRPALASFRLFCPVREMTLCFHTVPEFAGECCWKLGPYGPPCPPSETHCRRHNPT
jgi:hypothetical protein